MAMQVRFSLTALAVAFALSMAGWPALPVAAQDADLRALGDEIARLRKDLIDIQRFVYQGNVPVSAGEGIAVAPMGPEAEARAARTEVRFGVLEDQIRTLTGQIEEIAHGIDLVSDRVDKLIGDVDFRLTAIERAQAEAAGWKGAASGPGAAIPAPTQPSPTQEALVPPASGEPGILGTVSASALDAEDAAGATPAASASALPPTTPALPDGTAKQQYDYAFSLLRQHEYAEAERALTAFIAAHPDDQLTGNAHYWLAETFYVRGEYRKAVGYFAAGYKNYPESNKASDNLLKLGMSLVYLDETDKACLTFKELAERFPDASPSIKQRAAAEGQRAGCS